jgi:hypothetical protein
MVNHVKKATVVLLVALMLFGVTTSLKASEYGVVQVNNSAPETFILPASVNHLPRGANAESTVTTHAMHNDLFITDRDVLDEIVRLNNMQLPEGAVLREIVFLSDRNEGYVGIDPNAWFVILPPQLRVTNVRQRGVHDTFHYADTTQFSSISNHSFTETQVFTETFTKTRGAGWSSNAGISSGIVTAGVGFSVTATHTVSRQWTTFVPPRTRTTIETSAYASWFDFDVIVCTHESPWHNPGQRVGSGDAHRPSGVRIIVIDIPIW